MAHDAAHEALRLHRTGAQGTGQPRHQERRDRQGHQRHERQARRHVDQHGQETQHQQRLAEKDMETARHGVLHLRHVVRDAGEHVALPALAEPAHRQRGDLCEEVAADVLHHAGFQTHHDALREIAADVRQQAGQDDGAADEEQAADHAAVADDGGQQPAETICEIGQRPGERRPPAGRGCRLVVEEHGQERSQQAIVDHAEHHGQDGEQQVSGPVAAQGLCIGKDAAEGIHGVGLPHKDTKFHFFNLPLSE